MMNRFLVLVSLISLNTCLAGNRFIERYVYEWGERAPKVIEKYLKSSLNNPEIAYLLGNLYLTGTFLEKDIKKADLYITMASNKGLPEAHNSIGDGYYSGDIRKKDIQMAKKYYIKSAQMGYGPGQFNAGIVLMKYGTSKRDLELSVFYLDKASKNIDHLGSMVSDARKYKLDAKRKLHRYNDPK